MKIIKEDNDNFTNKTITLSYDDIVYEDRRGDEIEIDWDYEVYVEDIFEAILSYDSFWEDHPELDEPDMDELHAYLEEHFDDLFNEYYEDILDYYRDEATSDAQYNYIEESFQNPLNKQSRHNKKHNKKKHLLPFYNLNSGDSEKGNKFFNKANSTGDVPTSATADGTVGTTGAMGESMETKTFKVHYLKFPKGSDSYSTIDTTVEANSKEEAYQKVRKMLMQNKIVYRDLYIY